MNQGGFHYRAFGLNIASEIPCPELPEGTGLPDVHIRYGKTPEKLKKAKIKEVDYEISPDQLLFWVEGVGRYLISSGNEILIESPHGTEEAHIRLFLLGTAMGALLLQRGLLPFHGSAIEVQGECIVLLGDSGSGKSTLAAAFHKRGYRVLADDVCVIELPEGHRPIIFPGYPQIKIWADAARKIGENPGLLPRVHMDEDKHGLQFKEGFCSQPLPLRLVYLLNPSDVGTFELEQLKGIEKVTALIDNTYRLFFIKGLSKEISHFKQCIEVARHVPLTKVTRPREPFLLDELVNLLQKDINM